ncbi:hypothetical protein Fcan01_14381 [Folsomia candida]|uniref:Uncharacterized protein n=1 Tax=Folsomia candida TaxID=158441 RepID=A0A226E0I3_FOLCA|nr:hypothetical protein Fcan01_14381 [Folsomia candida]
MVALAMVGDGCDRFEDIPMWRLYTTGCIVNPEHHGTILETAGILAKVKNFPFVLNFVDLGTNFIRIAAAYHSSGKLLTRFDFPDQCTYRYFATTIGRLWNPKMFTDLYTQYFPLYSAVSGISELAFFCAMGATLMIGIAINFLTLRLYSKLPIILHLTTTAFAVVIPILVNLTLPPVVMTHEETRKLLKMRYLRYRPFRKQKSSFVQGDTRHATFGVSCGPL